MSSFDITCGLTHRGVAYGDRIVAIVLAPPEYSQGTSARDLNGPQNVTDILAPVSFALRGVYDDYGRIKVDDAEDESVGAVALRALCERGTYRDVTAILSDIKAGKGRLYDPTNYYKEPITRIGLWYAHEPVYDWVVNRWRKDARTVAKGFLQGVAAIKGQATIHDRQIAKILAGRREDTISPDDQDMIRFWRRATANLFSLGSHNQAEFGPACFILRSHHNLFLHHDFAIAIGVFVEQAYQHGREDFLRALADALGEAYAFAHGMVWLRRHFYMPGVVGPQFAAESAPHTAAFARFVSGLDRTPHRRAA